MSTNIPRLLQTWQRWPFPNFANTVSLSSVAHQILFFTTDLGDVGKFPLSCSSLKSCSTALSLSPQPALKNLCMSHGGINNNGDLHSCIASKKGRLAENDSSKVVSFAAEEGDVTATSFNRTASGRRRTEKRILGMRSAVVSVRCSAQWHKNHQNCFCIKNSISYKANKSEIQLIERNWKVKIYIWCLS